MAKLHLTILTGDRLASANLLGDSELIGNHLDSIAQADDPISAFENTRRDAIPSTALANLSELTWRADRPLRTEVLYIDDKQKIKKMICNHQDMDSARTFRELVAGDFGLSRSDVKLETVTTGEIMLWSLVQSFFVVAVFGGLAYLANDTQENGFDLGTSHYRSKGLAAILGSVVGIVGPYGFLGIGSAILAFLLGRATYKTVKKPSRKRLELQPK
ncbi:MAG: hypothetical protein AAF483_10095 [Planctomycetota bacterium]